MRATAPVRQARYENLELATRGEVAVLKLARPTRRNAWTMPMVHETSHALAACDADDAVRAVVITGSGDSFSVGADLSEGSISSPGSDEDPIEVMRSIVTPRDVRKPVIAAINGDAIGIGVTLSLLCDVRVIARDARLATPMTRLGVIPEMGAHWSLARIAGWGVAHDLLLTGRRIDGEEAVRLGVCGEAVDRDRVLERALEIAEDIARHTAPRAVAVSKYLLQKAEWTGFTELRAEETELFARVADEPDAEEGVAAFLERRPPRWSGRASAEPTWQAPGPHDIEEDEEF
ncbi:probable enoyl-CoA hydratase (plasmid) [Rhodococcus jostii RHA1]|uniref:Probable enoyl-CoA hydratase n=1 Tax=Rhodococcus jostii (strain RHA1) TaxID=101510 RepID=Q0RW31_RHOJR|nr:enoyl-CoA hydratase-related protein [Rhodococcus jostii]ABH00505.1 probable enoyl-CoA hydratase [Rhodococcus jostii RHA1]